MIQELKRHSHFKPTGLPWLERIPAHWSLVPNRALVRRRKQLVGRNHHRYKLLSLTKQGVIVRDVASGKGKFSSDMGTSQEVRNGDLVFCFFDVPETPRTVGLSSHHGMITGAYTVLEPLQPGIAPYLELFYRAMDDSKLLSPLYSGLRNTIPVDRFLGTKTPVPPPEEQATIVRFLDHANRRIDQFIRAKKKLIALLNEQKQAIIHRAVTRGLDPNAKMKDSGVPWLREIPAHWELRPLKHLAARIQNGATPPTAERRYYDNGTVPWYGPSSIAADELVEEPTRLLAREAFAQGKARLINGPALLVIVIGATVAKMALLDGEGATNQQITAFELRNDRVVPMFCVQQLRSSETWLRATASTATIPILDSYVVSGLPVALPPLAEQAVIANSAIRHAKPRVDAIARAQREIDLVVEYRTRLVSDVVTGQLDVRAAAASLPDLEPNTALPESSDDEADIDDAEDAT